MRKCQHCGVEDDKYNGGRTINWKTGITCRFCGENVRRYNMNRTEAIALLKEQNGECKLCETALEVAPGELKSKVKACHIDHCHDTGKVRGLLCIPCNTFLGKGRKDFEIKMEKINKYWNNCYGT